MKAMQSRTDTTTTSDLQVYGFEVRESLTAYYNVEAHNQEEAEALFNNWICNEGSAEVDYRLMKNSSGWDVFFLRENPNDKPDLTYEYLKEVYDESGEEF